MMLAALPVILVFLFINRERLSNIVASIERLKVGDYLELVFKDAGQRIERAVIPTVGVNEAVFSRKRGLVDLHFEVRRTLKELESRPLSERVIYLQVDFDKDGEDYFDAYALYIYLLVLREAAVKVQGTLAGVLTYGMNASKRNRWLIQTNDYLMEFERRFPEARTRINLREIHDLLNRPDEQDVNYMHFYGQLDQNADTSLINFLPYLRRYRRRVKFVEQEAVESLPRHLPQLLQRQIEYVVVLREGELFAVIPVATVTALVSKAVAEGVEEKEGRRKRATRR